MPIRARFDDSAEGVSGVSGVGVLLVVGGANGSSSQTLSTIPVRINAHREHVVRSRAKHHPLVQSGYIVAGRAGPAGGNETGSPDEDVVSSLKMYTWLGGSLGVAGIPGCEVLYENGVDAIVCTSDVLRKEGPQDDLLPEVARVGELGWDDGFVGDDGVSMMVVPQSAHTT